MCSPSAKTSNWVCSNEGRNLHRGETAEWAVREILKRLVGLSLSRRRTSAAAPAPSSLEAAGASNSRPKIWLLIGRENSGGIQAHKRQEMSEMAPKRLREHHERCACPCTCTPHGPQPRGLGLRQKQLAWLRGPPTSSLRESPFALLCYGSDNESMQGLKHFSKLIMNFVLVTNVWDRFSCGNSISQAMQKPLGTSREVLTFFSC